MHNKTSDISFLIPPYFKLLWVIIISVLFVIHLVSGKVDQVMLELLLLLSMPWILQVIESFKLPGGIELKVRIGKLENTVEDQKKELERQQDVVNKLVTFSMSGNIYGHLQRIYYAKIAMKNGQTRHLGFDKNNPAVREEFSYLRDHGYIHQINVDNLFHDQNLAEIVNLTPIGEWYVQLREKAEGS
jgi:hypothetical protein